MLLSHRKHLYRSTVCIWETVVPSPLGYGEGWSITALERPEINKPQTRMSVVEISIPL
jgi:hypothetical protein